MFSFHIKVNFYSFPILYFAFAPSHAHSISIYNIFFYQIYKIDILFSIYENETLKRELPYTYLVIHFSSFPFFLYFLLLSTISYDIFTTCKIQFNFLYFIIFLPLYVKRNCLVFSPLCIFLPKHYKISNALNWMFTTTMQIYINFLDVHFMYTMCSNKGFTLHFALMLHNYYYYMY